MSSKSNMAHDANKFLKHDRRKLMIIEGILLPILNTIDTHLFQVTFIDTQNKNFISNLPCRQALLNKSRKRTEECMQIASSALKSSRSIKQFTHLRTLNIYHSSYYVLISLKLNGICIFIVQNFHQNSNNKYHLLAMQNAFSKSKTVIQEVKTNLDTSWAF